jgi:hypothetical protein
MCCYSYNFEDVSDEGYKVYLDVLSDSSVIVVDKIKFSNGKEVLWTIRLLLIVIEVLCVRRF